MRLAVLYIKIVLTTILYHIILTSLLFPIAHFLIDKSSKGGEFKEFPTVMLFQELKTWRMIEQLLLSLTAH